MLWGALLPYKSQGSEGSEGEEDDFHEEEEEPQFLDADEMSGDGIVLTSAHCRSRIVTIDDQTSKKTVDVTGRFPLLGPWWKVRVYGKLFGKMYYMRGYPSYFLQTEFAGDKPGVLSLFLKECSVPEQFIKSFIEWLSGRDLKLHKLEQVLRQFSSEKESGYDILTYVQNSCAGVNVKNALQYPLIMEYLPTLLPRLFKNLLRMEKVKRNSDGAEVKETGQDSLFSKKELLADIEEMLEDSPWKFGFSPITYRELKLVHCEASLKAFQQCEALFTKIPELQRNALVIYNHLKQRSQETGDTYVEQEMLTKAVSQGMSVNQAWKALEFLEEEEIVMREKDRIFLTNLYWYEKDIASCIEKIMWREPWRMNVDIEQVLRTEQAKWVEPTGNNDISEEIRTLLQENQEPNVGTVDPPNNTAFQGSTKLEVDPDQVRAAEMICSNPLTVISGKGGCGKTTLVSLLFRYVLLKECEEVEKACKAFEKDLDASQEWSTQTQQPVKKVVSDPLRVLLTAPTGKAASLLKKKTNLSSFTLHQITASYYHWRKSGTDKWKFSTVKALVVDEGSLVSVQILSSVLKLLCKHANLSKLVILGDIRQLPSINPGNMLTDVFQSAKDIHWAIELRTNHRAESQLIVDNATRISERKNIQFDAIVEIGRNKEITMPSPEKKFILVSLPIDGRVDDLQTAVKALLGKGPGLEDDRTSQFIAFRREDCDLINELCCKHYSKHPTRGLKKKPRFECQDKVCCTKNAYVKDLIPTPERGRYQIFPSSQDQRTTLKRKTTIHIPSSQEQGVSPSPTPPPKADMKPEKSQSSEEMLCSEERFCNGEIFFVTDDVERDRVRCLTLRGMDERVYELDYWKLRANCDIKHAWARTIHTFQGSEEGTIVYVVGKAGRQNWQHVYTAVTRGRQRVYVIARKDQLNYAVSNKSRPRKTRLRHHLKETLAQRNNCSAATSSPPLGTSREKCAPTRPVILSQEKDIQNIKTLVRSPLAEHPSNGETMVTTPNRKRMVSSEEVAESPSKTARVILDESPFGSTVCEKLSLTSTCKKLFFPKEN